MKIWHTGMTTAEAIGILRQAGVLGMDVREGIPLTREYFEDMTPERKQHLIELRERVGTEKFRELMFRAMNRDSEASPPAPAKAPLVTALPPTQRMKKQKPKPRSPKFDTQEFRENNPQFKDMAVATPAEVTLGKDPEREAIRLVRERQEKDHTEMFDDTKTREMRSLRHNRNFTIDRAPPVPVQKSSWLDQFIAEH